jgi:signal transduction histidine kinase
MSGQITELIQNLSFKNLDLLSVGATIAAIGLLGFVILLNNRKSITNQTFFIFSIVTILWSFLNYISYQQATPDLVLWLQRGVIFLAVWHAFTFFQFFYVFPAEKKPFPKLYKFLLFPYVALVSVINLTPLVFSGVAQTGIDGSVSKMVVAPGVLFFITAIIGLIIASVVIFIKKIIKAKQEEKIQYRLILIGTVLTFALLITFNLLLPVAFTEVRFIPLGALFIFPFVAFTFYAIYKHNLFNVKVAAVVFVAFIISLFSFFNILFAASASQVAINITFFLAIIVGSILLIKTILREIEERERIQMLNTQLDSIIHLVSHEVKGALGKSRMVFNEIIDGDYGAPTPQMAALASGADRDVKKTVDMVMDILSSANLKRGTLTLAKAPFDMKDAVQEVVASLTPEAAAKGLYLRIEIPEGTDFTYSGDREQIVQHVIRNLIDNSIKYTPTGGITVSLSGGMKGKENLGKIVLSVKDTGVGIPKEDMPRMFTEGGKGHDSTRINVHSTGYGLYFARVVVEAHKGRMWVESEGPEKGSQFYAEFK